MKLDQLFFAFTDRSKAPPQPVLGPGYRAEFWAPRRLGLRPTGLPWLPFGAWGLFHYGRLFSNRHYQLILIRRVGVIVHRSCVFPRYFRFPFMTAEDLQVGDTWTAPDERGKGLAKWALGSAATRCRTAGTTLWYVCDETNEASAAVAKKAGFQWVGRGARKKTCGMSLLGHFEIIQHKTLPPHS